MDGYQSDEDIFLPPGSKKEIRIVPSPPKEGVMTTKLNAIRQLVTGIPPPPEKTNPDYNLLNVLSKYEKNLKDFSWNKSSTNGNEMILGLFLNVDKSCEEWERLLQIFASRYVSNETYSYTSRPVFMSESAKKRKKGWTSSPRTRISYLSKRRSMFQGVNPSKKSILVDESLKAPRRSLFTSPEEKYKTPESGRSRPKVIGGGRQGSPLKRFGSEKKKCSRSLFETNDEQTLSKQHKQKLLWAVSMAMRERGMSSKDSNFKEAASKLYSSTQSSWLNRKESETKSGSTSDQMLDFAREIAESLNIGTSAKENKSPRKRQREETVKNSPSKSLPGSFNVLRISPQKKRAKTGTPTSLLNFDN